MRPDAHPDCTRCPQHCCNQLDVHLTASDIARLAWRLDLPGEAFVDLAVTEGSTPDSFLLAPTGPEYELLLARRSGDGDGPAPCVLLLVLLEGSGRCGAYEHRPRVCRTYPFFLEGDLARVDADHLCPEEALDPARVDAAAMRLELMRKTAERDVHRRLLDGWNRTVASAPDDTVRTVGDLLEHLFAAEARTAPALAPVLEDEALLEAWCEASLAVHSPLSPLGGDLLAGAGVLKPHLDAIRRAAG